MSQATGQGSFNQGHRSPAVTPPFASGARNGLSIDAGGNIVWGDPQGSTGPADLLNNREIDFDDFFMSFLNAHLQIFGSAAGQEMYIESAISGGAAFLIDSNAGAYAMGNIIGGMLFAVDDSNGQVEIRDQVDTYLEISTIAQFAQFGTGQIFAQNIFDPFNPAFYITDSLTNFGFALFPDVLDLGLPTFGPGVRIDNSADQISMTTTGGGLLGFEITGVDSYNMGDLTFNTNGVAMYLDNLGNTITLQVDMFPGLYLDGPGMQYILGDVNSNFNGMRAVVDRNLNSLDVTNTALNATYAINGNNGANGSFVAGAQTVTVEGGIITSIV